MPRYRFVDPDTMRYDLSDGDWIEVKKYLTAGDRKKLEGAGVPSMRREDKGPAFELDYVKLGLGRIEAYVVNWSFADKAGNQSHPDFATIATLDSDTVDEIDKVLDAHVKAMEAEKNARKTVPSGAVL